VDYAGRFLLVAVIWIWILLLTWIETGKLIPWKKKGKVDETER